MLICLLPQDLTYAIAVDQDKKRLLVVFRGAITKQDWSKAMDAEQKKVKNPISEDFDGRPAKIGIYNGFYEYLFRVRKDTGTTKFDEIVNLAHQYGINRVGEDYHLAVTGHSLGAALATVFSFYASTDERFTRNGPIKVISFGSPMIGGNDFADCFRHQEEHGKIMYARFYNHNDLVAYLPANFTIAKVSNVIGLVHSLSFHLLTGFCFRVWSAGCALSSCRHWSKNSSSTTTDNIAVWERNLSSMETFRLLCRKRGILGIILSRNKS
jgi:predicted lipase